MEYNSSLILDGILLALLLICAIRGYLNGFLTSIINLVGSFAAFIAAWYVSSHYSQTVFDSYLRETFVERCYNYFVGVSRNVSVEEALSNVLGKFPQSFVDTIISKTEFALSTMLSPTRESAEIFIDSVVSPIVVSIISIVLLIAVFAVLSLICHIVAKILKNVNDVPIIGTPNKIGGFFVGVINGAINIIILSFILSIIVIITKDSLTYLNSAIIGQSKILTLTAVINPFMS